MPQSSLGWGQPVARVLGCVLLQMSPLDVITQPTEGSLSLGLR